MSTRHAERAEAARVIHGPTLHGTKAGYERHKRSQEPACDVCRKAQAKYMQERRADPAKYAADKRDGRINSRALWILAKRHRDEFRSIVAELREAS